MLGLGIGIPFGKGRRPSLDPYLSNVVYLNGFQGAGWANSEVGGHVGTLQNSTQSTAGKFDSNNLYTPVGNVNYPDSADWHFSNGPFTIETWVNFAGTTGSSFCHLIGQMDTGTNQNSWCLSHDTGTVLLYLSTTGANLITVAQATSGIANSTWAHVAADFDGTTYRTYVNGVMKGKTIAAHTLFNSSARMTVGSILNAGAINTNFFGYQDEVRVTKGVARYASDAGFTPPTANFPRT